MPAPLRHPARHTGPCRADRRSAGASTVPTELHCRKTSECEREGKLLQTAIFSDRQELTTPSLPPTAPRNRQTPSPVIESQWVRVREGEKGVRRENQKTFLFSGFSSRQHQVGNRKRWQCSLLVDEWHLCRLSILLLLLLELSKMSKLCLSILQILAWPATQQHYQT